jgi:glycine/D-amino acid oxidase-like deaminating enzyme
MSDRADVIVVGGGLAGLVATAELADAGRRVLLVDQEPEVSLGGQAFWSFGGLFLVDSPEQRRLRIKDSHELAWQDWLGTAEFDRPEASRGRYGVVVDNVNVNVFAYTPVRSGSDASIDCRRRIVRTSWLAGAE